MGNRSGTTRRYGRYRQICLKRHKAEVPNIFLPITQALPTKNVLSRFPFGGSPLSGEGLLDACRAHGIRQRQTIKQSVWAGFQELSQTGESCQSDRKNATLNVADGFPMHTDQFGQTLLGQGGFQPRFTHMLSNQTEHLFISHASSWHENTPLLTPRIHSVKNCGCKRRLRHPNCKKAADAAVRRFNQGMKFGYTFIERGQNGSVVNSAFETFVSFQQCCLVAEKSFAGKPLERIEVVPCEYDNECCRPQVMSVLKTFNGDGQTA